MDGLYVVREIKEEEIGLLEDFLYECIFQRPENEPLPRSGNWYSHDERNNTTFKGKGI